MSKLLSALSFLGVLLVGPVHAQQPNPIDGVMSRLMGTTFARVLPSFANGNLYGCGIEFSVITRDWQYKRGAYIRVGGQFGLMSGKGSVAPILKVTLHDINTQNFTFTPFAPASAYFVDRYETTSQYVKGKIESDTPGAIFVVFNGPPVFKVIADGVANGRVHIAISRAVNGADIPVEIETDVVDVEADGKRRRSPQIGPDFFACSSKLLDAAK